MQSLCIFFIYITIEAYLGGWERWLEEETDGYPQNESLYPHEYWSPPLLRLLFDEQESISSHPCPLREVYHLYFLKFVSHNFLKSLSYSSSSAKPWKACEVFFPIEISLYHVLQDCPTKRLWCCIWLTKKILKFQPKVGSQLSLPATFNVEQQGLHSYSSGWENNHLTLVLPVWEWCRRQGYQPSIFLC